MFKEQSRGQCEWIEGREDERERKIKWLPLGLLKHVLQRWPQLKAEECCFIWGLEGKRRH